MTTEPGHDGGPPRRKFDDIASLFGTIVPAPGQPAPPTVLRPPPPAPPPPPPEPPLSPASIGQSRPPTALRAELAKSVEISTVPSDSVSSRADPSPPVNAPASTPPGLDLKPAPRPRPTEIPWPDAFEPRPNFRQREPKKLTWLLLIPAGIVAAFAITLFDPRIIRTWIDANLLQRAPATTAADNRLLPAPFRTPAPNDVAPQAPIAYPAIPTSPVPGSPDAESSPPPADPAEAAAASAPIHVTIQYRRNIPGADGEARRIAALLQSYGGSIELRPNTTTTRAPTINYYNPADRNAATALAGVLANEAATWTVRPGTAKNPPGALDIWLP